MYILFFLFSLIVATQVSSVYNNYTYLSYTNDMYFLYAIWVISLSNFLLYKVIYIFKKCTYAHRYEYVLFFSTFIFLMLGAFLPYLPNTSNLYSTLHVAFSILAIISMSMILKLLIYRIQYLDFVMYQTIDTYYTWAMFSFMSLLIMFGSINIVIEVFYTGIVLKTLHSIEKVCKKGTQCK